MAKFRKGDIVSVKFIVESQFNEIDLRLRQESVYGDVYAKAVEVEMVRPKIEVGDTIRWKADVGTIQGEVLAIANDHAWVDRGRGDYSTVWLTNATRVDPDQVEDNVRPLVPRFTEDELPPKVLETKHLDINAGGGAV